MKHVVTTIAEQQIKVDDDGKETELGFKITWTIGLSDDEQDVEWVIEIDHNGKVLAVPLSAEVSTIRELLDKAETKDDLLHFTCLDCKQEKTYADTLYCAVANDGKICYSCWNKRRGYESLTNDVAADTPDEKLLFACADCGREATRVSLKLWESDEPSALLCYPCWNKRASQTEDIPNVLEPPS